MTLKEISKLQKGSYKVIDRTKDSHYPMRWMDIIHILVKDKHKAVRRYNAYLYGLCDGSKEEFPSLDRRGGAYQNAGRKPIPDMDRKVPVKIGVKKSVVQMLGGVEELQRLLVLHVSSLESGELLKRVDFFDEVDKHVL